MSQLLLPFVASLLAALALTPIIRHFARKSNLVAKPVADRWHEQPTPLLGGVAVYGGFVVGGAIALGTVFDGPTQRFYLSGSMILGIIGASSLMFHVGLIDDRLKLRPATKLIGQL